MKSEHKQLLLNSSVAFVLAGMVATTVHEISHFVASLLLREPVILYPPFVGNHPDVSDKHGLIIAAAGPIFSLVSGLIIILASKNRGQGFSKLFWTWLGFLSAEIGFGYFFIAPFVKVGDTGFALSVLHSAWYMYVLVFALGVFGYLFLLPRLFGKEISRLVRNKKSFYFAGMYPWLVGTGVLLLIYFLIENVIMTAQDIGIFSLMGVATIGIFTPWAGYSDTSARKSPLQIDTPYLAIAITIIVALLLMFGLTHGIQHGSGPFA